MLHRRLRRTTPQLSVHLRHLLLPFIACNPYKYTKKPAVSIKRRQAVNLRGTTLVDIPDQPNFCCPLNIHSIVRQVHTVASASASTALTTLSRRLPVAVYERSGTICMPFNVPLERTSRFHRSAPGRVQVSFGCVAPTRSSLIPELSLLLPFIAFASLNWVDYTLPVQRMSIGGHRPFFQR
ncbi:hypothetical protein PAECIP111892_04228 [Paenibacillus auburnensis]|jgi:hypothetical protein|uniref:Uncharacterized protein n=1 Tax=Paenibacillus auburnensis TaxID=2905649 RepID=A0ABN8GRG9_9BACL|nr:hypothetical protein PAECIP111892_04228 [Paenibacillus auburnensis]